MRFSTSVINESANILYFSFIQSFVYFFYTFDSYCKNDCCFVPNIKIKKTLVVKNIYTFFLITATLFGCQDNIETSLPAFQSLKNGDFQWKSTVSSAVSDATGVTTFTGSDGFGTIILQIPELVLGSYELGSSSVAVASYLEDGFEYSTLNNGVGSIVYTSDGLISVEEIDETGAITGSFYFSAYSASGTNVVNFSEGILYKLTVINP